jgi:hypothetical protein
MGGLHKPRVFGAITLRVRGLPPGLENSKGVLKKATVGGKGYEGLGRLPSDGNGIDEIYDGRWIVDGYTTRRYLVI